VVGVDPDVVKLVFAPVMVTVRLVPGDAFQGEIPVRTAGVLVTQKGAVRTCAGVPGFVTVTVKLGHGNMGAAGAVDEIAKVAVPVDPPEVKLEDGMVTPWPSTVTKVLELTAIQSA
jgi:hypothetical protein